MRFLIIAILLSLLAHSSISYGQPHKVKFGKIDKGTVGKTDYPDYPEAEAIILYDKGTSDFKWVPNTGFTINFVRHVRIKILKESGFDWASFEIPLYILNSNEEKIYKIKAETSNLVNGKVETDKLDRDDIFMEEFNERWNIAKFTMPNVREGSVIEVTYEVKTDYLHRLRNWDFQYDIPVLWSEYMVEIPEYFRYNRNMRGLINLEVYEETTGTGHIEEYNLVRESSMTRISHTSERSALTYITYIYHYAAKDLPPVKEEPYMPALVNYKAGMIFELVSIEYPNEPVESISKTWEDLNGQLLDEASFGGQVNKSGYAGDRLEMILAGTDDDHTRLLAIYEMVRDRMKWNEKNRVFATTTLRSAYKDRTGSSADINLMLTALLREAGIEAWPVLVSTRSNGFVTMTRPTIEQFNYVISMARIGDETLLMDATEKYNTPGILPERCLNLQARLVNDTDGEWVSLIPGDDMQRTVMYDVNIMEDGTVSGSAGMMFKQYAAYSERLSYASHENKDDYPSDLLYDIPGLQVTQFDINDLDSIYKPLEYSFEYQIDGYSEIAGELMFFNPLIFARIRDNIFTEASERKYPVDFKVPIKQIITSTIHIPEGYEIDALPEPKVFKTPDNQCVFRYNVVPLGKMINFTCTMDIKSTIFNTDVYPILYEFYKAVVEAEDEHIVLKKRKT